MKTLAKAKRASLLETLQSRFEAHVSRHEGIRWSNVLERLEAQPNKLWSISQLERTGGEPDVVECDTNTGEYIFMDCAKESPKARRSVCYDQAALDARKKHKPKNSAVNLACEMGATLLSEEQYTMLQRLGEFDTKTSSWLDTPAEIRALGGAIFGDFRFGRVFVYHNSAESYYGTRGFRCVVRV